MADNSESMSQPGLPPLDADVYSPLFLEQRRQAVESAAVEFRGIDGADPTMPSGHDYAIRKSTDLTSFTKRHQRKAAMDITPQDVIDVLNAANINNWVLMGLHGYVGYMPSPRATQDVDVMVPYSERGRAKKAIATKWPELLVREISQVTRFLDPLDVDSEGNPKPVVDLMHPWSPFQELILKEHVIVDEQTQHRIPTIEAALVSKYAAIVSPYRDRDKKDYDAGDFRRLVRANRGRIRELELRSLAELVWEGGGDDIRRFLDIAISEQPFPI